MEVAPDIDYGFNSSSYDGTYYTSDPSIPTRLAELYSEFDELLITSHVKKTTCLATVPFAWEEKPGVPKTGTLQNLFEHDFSFDVSCHFDNNNIPAEDLFDGGLIRTDDCSTRKVERARGRERGFSASSRLPSSRSRRTRSLSPLGKSDYRREQMVPPSSPNENGSRKWSFIDFLLFRSASDGRAIDRDPLKKYSNNLRKHDHDVRNSGSMSKRRGHVSAHELHYNVNRAISDDMKKKTYLPYKQGILGRFSFNP